KCYVDTPDQNVGITIKEFVQDMLNNRWGIKSAELTTTYAGTYYVVYTATDDAGNSVSYISTFEVANTEKGYIEVENGSNISKFVGEDVTLNINLAGNGDYSNFVPVITWGENKPSGLGEAPNSFKFDKAGTYVATISGTYWLNGEKQNAEPSVTVTITVNEPTLSWSNDVNEYFTEKKGSTSEIGDRINLDVISATEKGAIELEVNAEPKVVYTDKNGKEVNVTLEYDVEGQHYYFTTTEDAVYTVSYTATTDYNSDTKSYTITCGDHYDPTVIIDGNKLQDSKVTYNGTDINVTAKLTQKDVNDVDQPGKYILTVTAKEGDKTVFSYDIDVTLKDTNSSKTTVDLDVNSDDYKIELIGDNCSSNGTNSWTISGVGSYELKLTVNDDNDNATPKSIKFNVANKTEPKSIKDSVVGIALIIVSVVVLGGVILFFALAGKRNKSKRKSINKD
ncbi:MAG: hypothetical protein J6Q15_00830, partial [Clostridia bacterium]|nr:hypothetical protein [Clostridia bacterium]